jgi:hypothetical protein
MLVQWIARLWAIWRTPSRRAAKPVRPRLAITLLETRSVPSVTSWVFIDQPRELAFDLLAIHRDPYSQAENDRWSVALDRCDPPEEPTSPETMTIVTVAALSFGTAAIAPYDREEDAHWQLFHGARVA